MSDVSPLSGPEMAARMKRGTRVKRGADWRYGGWDGPVGVGRVTRGLDKNGWVRVKWRRGCEHWYRMGFEDKYDLQLAKPRSVPQQTRE